VWQVAGPSFSWRMVASVVQQAWDVYRETSSQSVAGSAVGFERSTVTKWMAVDGGVRPRSGRHPSGKRLAFEDRCAVEAGLAVGESQSSIAERIGFHRCTVSREVRQGGLASGRYSAKRGQAVATANGWVKAVIATLGGSVALPAGRNFMRVLRWAARWIQQVIEKSSETTGNRPETFQYSGGVRCGTSSTPRGSPWEPKI
jgi:hypothetical protein